VVVSKVEALKYYLGMEIKASSESQKNLFIECQEYLNEIGFLYDDGSPYTGPMPKPPTNLFEYKLEFGRLCMNIQLYLVPDGDYIWLSGNLDFIGDERYERVYRQVIIEDIQQLRFCVEKFDWYHIKYKAWQDNGNT